MPDYSTSNKIIAKNTLLLYVRMLFSMIVGLYTSRVVLQVLGVVDYGVYNVVGGVVGMLGFLSTTMSGATSRFITYALGEGDENKLSKTFDATLIIHICIAIIVALLAEIIGLCFLCYKFNIPQESMHAAYWVLHFSVMSAALCIVQVPYNACIIAHEKMNVFAYAEMANMILKLVIVFILQAFGGNKLITYALLLLCVSILITGFYTMYSILHYSECRFHRCIDKKILKSIFNFSAWDMLGHVGVSFRDQGSNMVLNIFWGPVLNAAAGLAITVQNVVYQFAGNVVTAIRPQIIKRYSVNDIQSTLELVYSSQRINLCLILLVVIPMFFEMPFLLQLWLAEVPDYLVVFCRLILIVDVLKSYSNITYIAIQATGDIRQVSIIRSVIYILSPIILYLVFRAKFTYPEIAFVLMIFGQFCQCVFDTIVMKRKFPQLQFSKLINDVIKIVAISFVVIVVLYYSSMGIENQLLNFIIVVALSIVLIAVGFSAFVLTKAERDFVINTIKERIRR